MDNEEIMRCLTEICETISLRGVYANYGWCSEKLSAILSIDDPAEINEIMLHISRFSFLKTTRSVYQWSTVKYASLLGLNDRHQLYGKLDIELAWGNQVSQAFQEAEEKVVIESSQATVECKARLADTTERFLKTKLYPVYNNNKKIVGILGVVRELISPEMLNRKANLTVADAS